MTGVAVRSLVLLAATVTTGLATGAFALYAHTIMPGLKGTDDRTFVGAFQALDRAIINPWFMAGGFFGSLVLTASAAWANRHEPAFAWILVALALSLLGVVITMAVNVPLNDAIKAAGDPDRVTDLSRVRDAFHEGRWAAWNLVRTLVSLAALGCLAWALVLHGRATA